MRRSSSATRRGQHEEELFRSQLEVHCSASADITDQQVAAGLASLAKLQIASHSATINSIA